MNSITPYHFSEQVAWMTLSLLVQRKALLHPAGVAFYVWQRGERLVVAFDPNAIELNRVNEDFAHTLSTRLHGRRVVRTNSRGMFLQVGFEIPKAQMPFETLPLDLSQQPTPWHVPVGMTREGPLWINFLDGDSYLISGIRDGGKSGEIHAFIQALLHGRQTMVYAWDQKSGAEFGRYIGRENFYFRLDAMDMLMELESMLKERKKILTTSGFPNTRLYNEANHGVTALPPIAVFVDEAAELPDKAKDKLIEMIRVQRYTGCNPVVATNQPTVAAMFPKNNLSTRIAFRVPHHTDSVTILGYKGAESLPAVRGRGLILWGGKFVEFQSFEVTYPMPSSDAMKLIAEQQAEAEEEAVSSPRSEVERLAESIRAEWKPEMSKSAVSRLLGKAYAGSSWTAKVDGIIEHLRSTTTPPTPESNLQGAVVGSSSSGFSPNLGVA